VLNDVLKGSKHPLGELHSVAATFSRPLVVPLVVPSVIPFVVPLVNRITRDCHGRSSIVLMGLEPHFHLFAVVTIRS
jgi:hypothetical protein